MATEEYIIKFNNDSDRTKVSDGSKKILKEIMKESKVYTLTITSTARDSYDQARIMYNNIEAHGVKAQKKLYGSSGDKVIDAYSEAQKAGKDKSGIILAMKATIYTIGPNKVSRHCVDVKKLNVIDIAPSSISLRKKADFEKAIKNIEKISRYFFPPNDPAYHIEIDQ